MNAREKIIEVTRKDGEDPMRVAARAARAHGTSLKGNLRWRGICGPEYRDIGTKDGRVVIVWEPRVETN